MAKVDTKEWKEFRVGDLFDIHPTKSYKLVNAQLMDDGQNPVVVNSSTNNDIGGFSTQKTTEKGGIITFSDTTDAESIFYQPDDFIGYPHVQGMYPIGKYQDKWNESTMLFFAIIFKVVARSMGFDYVNKFTRECALEMSVPIPTNADGEPDWDYMDEYMLEVMQESQKNLASLGRDSKKKRKVDLTV